MQAVTVYEMGRMSRAKAAHGIAIAEISRCGCSSLVLRSLFLLRLGLGHAGLIEDAAGYGHNSQAPEAGVETHELGNPTEETVAENASEAHGGLDDALDKIEAPRAFSEIGGDEGEQDSINAHRNTVQGLE